MIQPGGIYLTGLRIGYSRQPVLGDLSGVFAAGSATAIVGPNGAGKSTLLKAIAGLLRPMAGAVTFEGYSRRDVGYLPQRAEIDRGFPITVMDFALLGAWRRRRALSGFGSRETGRALDALQRVDLMPLQRRFIAELSIGQFQRLLFARLIVQDAHIILLDEPFAAIDTATTSLLLGVIAQWHAEGRTLLAALHDLAQVGAYFPQALLINRSVLGWGPSGKLAGQIACDHPHHHLEDDCVADAHRIATEP